MYTDHDDAGLTIDHQLQAYYIVTILLSVPNAVPPSAIVSHYNTIQYIQLLKDNNQENIENIHNVHSSMI